MGRSRRTDRIHEGFRLTPIPPVNSNEQFDECFCSYAQRYPYLRSFQFDSEKQSTNSYEAEVAMDSRSSMNLHREFESPEAQQELWAVDQELGLGTGRLAAFPGLVLPVTASD